MQNEMHSSIFSYLRKKKVEVIVPSSLPDDVIEEIFIRLPVKELIRLKFSLPQEWRLRIESHGFGPRFHIYNPKLHPMFILFVKYIFKCLYIYSKSGFILCFTILLYLGLPFLVLLGVMFLLGF